ncbi:flavin monoamine oxidase family protein [Glaciihabitans sp. dw_435]|uniref:flavin monoamine oxidase family protein n=1 Tax=Glaciihabitans sp. dw_435 TaxID=2720081 RepID=UPI001BD47A1A|nr:flavin monoamine oxidase family protein [Glaciihabitans sp. dw_435]
MTLLSLDTPEIRGDGDIIDVVVVGAGLAGLSAARNLVALGRSVVVFEAADRVGGRTKAASVAGVHVDLGGTFVGPTQDRIIALAEEVGVGRFDTWEHGSNVVSWRGAVKHYRGTIPPIGAIGLLDIARVQASIDRIGKSIDTARPWLSPNAAKWDSHSLKTWLQSIHALQSSHDLMSIVTGTTWGCEPSEISFLQVLRYIKMAGGISMMLDTRGGAQEEHFTEGSWQISARVAEALGDRVHLDSPVTSIEWDDTGATVTAGEHTVRARRVIVAVPPALRTRITFSPALPYNYAALSQRWPQGVLSKAYAVYETPFWREAGLSGQALSDRGPVFITFDASPQDASAGVLLGFIGGDMARGWDNLPEEERRVRALSSFAEMFGPRALEPTGFVDQRWATEQWTGGGPTAAPGVGTVAASAPYLTAPVGPINWAGTETAERWSGFMDGAVRSGERAARDASAALSAASVSTTAKAL